MVDVGREPLAMTGHVVILPRANPHRTLRLVRDVDLLLAATIASVRMNRPTVVFEPPASLAACDRCHAAYEEARRIIEGAGGIAKWMERFMQPEWGSKADRGEVEA
jgi:ribosomal protein L31